MSQEGKKQANFVCNSEGALGPVYDSSSQCVKYKFVDYLDELTAVDEESYQIIKRIRKAFTQFKEKLN